VRKRSGSAVPRGALTARGAALRAGADVAFGADLRVGCAARFAVDFVAGSASDGRTVLARVALGGAGRAPAVEPPEMMLRVGAAAGAGRSPVDPADDPPVDPAGVGSTA
jgi:hypothetical protein